MIFSNNWNCKIITAEIVKTAELGQKMEAATEYWSSLLNIQTDRSTNTSRPLLSHPNQSCLTTPGGCSGSRVQALALFRTCLLADWLVVGMSRALLQVDGYLPWASSSSFLNLTLFLADLTRPTAAL